MFHVPDLSWTKIKLPYDKQRLWHTACDGDQGEVIIFGGCKGNILSPRLPVSTFNDTHVYLDAFQYYSNVQRGSGVSISI